MFSNDIKVRVYPFFFWGGGGGVVMTEHFIISVNDKLNYLAAHFVLYLAQPNKRHFLAESELVTSPSVGSHLGARSNVLHSSF